MGNCLGKSSHHERLNEFHYSYFETVQARNLLSRSTKRHPWRKKDSALSGLGNTPIMTEFDQQDEETTFLESPHSLATTTQSSTVSLPQHEQNHQHQRHQEATFGEKGWDPLSIDDSVDAWKERKRGAALELRLAKNRYLQFVSSALMNQDLSPVSLDSKIQSPRYFHPTNMKEKLNNEFENAIANGVIWEEVTRPKKVSAIAMSRNDTWLEGRSSLLFAIGTEDGVLTLIEIQDEPLKWSDQSVDSGGPVCQNFGAQVELPLVGRIRAIDFSPDGAYLVAGGDGCIAYLVAIVRHESTKALKDMKVLRQVERVDRIYAVRFSPDSQSLAFGGFDSKIAFGTIASFLSKERPLLTEAPVSGLVFCMDWSEAYVAVGTSGDNGFAIVDNLHNLVRCISRPSSVEALKWKPDGTLLAVGDREVVVYDSETFDIKCEICEALRSHDTTSHKYRVSALCWSPDGSFLAIGGSDGICFVVETSGFTLVHELRRPCRIVSLAWGQQRMLNGERKRFLGISDDSCKVALLKAGIETDESTAGDEDILSSPSASFNTGTTSEWVLREGCFRDVEDVLAERPPRSKAEGTITSIAFSRCSKSRSSSYLAYVSEDCSLTILSTHDWSAILQMDFAKPIRSLSFCHSNNYLALGGDEGVLFVLSVPNRSVILNMVYDSPIQSIAFSRHDERLSVGLFDGVLSLLCPSDDWKSCGEIDYSDSTILCQDWSSNYLSIGRQDGSVAVFDKEKALDEFFVPVAEFSAESAPIRSVAFGAGGRNLVFGGDTGIVSIANRMQGWACSKLKLRKSVLATKWSPGGRYIVFTGVKQTLRMIDTLTGSEVEEIQETLLDVFKADARNNLTTVDFSADGKFVAFGCSDGGVHILSSPNWQAVCPPID